MHPPKPASPPSPGGPSPHADAQAPGQNLHLLQCYRDHARLCPYRPVLKAREAGGWRQVTWGELALRMDRIALGLIRLGHRPGQTVGLCARNMPEWTLADLGILAARGVTVPLYPSSLLEQARYIIADAGIRILFAGESEQVELGLSLVAEGGLDRVVALDPSGARPGVLTLEALMDLGQDAEGAAELAARTRDSRPEDLLTLVYTSGTTGHPKGVMLDHGNLSAAMAMHDRRVRVEADAVSLCMLPLTHIFERAWTFYVLYRRGTNVYLRDPQTALQMLQEARPTHMCGVPRIYEKAFGSIHARVEQAPAFRRRLFHWAVGVGTAVVLRREQGAAPGPWLAAQRMLAERLVFRKVRSLFGGRVQFLPVGGGRLADEVNLFFQAVGLRLTYGYGLTETCASVAIYDQDACPLGTIGRPLEGLEVRIGEDQEIQVKGPTVMRGYFNRPEETAQVMTADGFLRTGDAGGLDAQGRLVFTERIKELCKTSNGQYVAPQKVEGALGKDPFIDQIAVIADERSFVSALIVPSFEALEAHARAMGLQYRNLADLIVHSRVVAFFEARIQALQEGLAHHEQVKKFTLLHRPFTVEMGELTHTLKLCRRRIDLAYRAEIEAMYQKPKGGD